MSRASGAGGPWERLMRICIVSQEYPPETARGGIGTQAYDKAHGMVARGHDVIVLSRGKQPSVVTAGGVTVIRLPFNTWVAHTEAADWVGHSADVAEELLRIHERTPLDLVEFAEYGSEAYVFLLNRTQWNYIPVAIHLHGPMVMLAHMLEWPQPEEDFYQVGRHMEQLCLRKAEAIYSSSQLSIDWVVKEYGLNGDAMPVLHTGIDCARFSPQPVPKDERPTIIFVGRVVKNKGVIQLVDAACELGREIPGIRLRIFGGGDARLFDQLRATARSHGLNDLLDVPGFVQREDLPAELSKAHVFAAPSWYEGGPGFVFLEAMACGLPVIGCSGSGASEVIVPGENGELVTPKDVPTLVTALRKLLDPTVAADMGRRARQFVLDHADAVRCMDQLEAFYEEVVAQHGHKRQPLAQHAAGVSK
jgi:glycosyltransferase involved in cell wall biosynthesis